MVNSMRNRLLFVIVTVNCMPFNGNRPPEPQNDAFQKCLYELKIIFDDHFGRKTALDCIKTAITRYTLNDLILAQNYPKAFKYYNLFDGKTKNDGIIDQHRFCEDLADSEATKLIRFTVRGNDQIGTTGSEVNKLTKWVETRDKCLRDTLKFGNDKDIVVYNIIYRFMPNDDKTDYGNDYITHVQGNIVLKSPVDIVDPWMYCYKEFPDRIDDLPMRDLQISDGSGNQSSLSSY